MNDPSKGSAQTPPRPGNSIDLASESVAGEEDPGAALDLPGASPASINPGDEAPPGTPGTGETICRICGGTGKLSGLNCQNCGGTGRVIAGLGGG